ncbi:MAG TPA: phosphoenolpyruvate--protein phosphotransferase [Bacteriovoracaceae bacterium]|nr:phosphoenolpyruvate--protein phosphotransferase [Bacteriovoracaceae bacterium]
MLKGTITSSGIGIGRAVILHQAENAAHPIHVTDPAPELLLFQAAVAEAVHEVEALRVRTLAALGEDKAAIFEAHAQILQDPEFQAQVREEISTHRLTAVEASRRVSQTFIRMFQEMDNAYMRERAIDVKDVTGRLLRKLQQIPEIDLSSFDSDTILIAGDITPSQMAMLDHKKVKGIITEAGGKNSHTSIMARTLEIPAMAGVKDATTLIKASAEVILDAEAGVILWNPQPEVKNDYSKKILVLEEQKRNLLEYLELEPVTADGSTVSLYANISSPQDLASVIKNGAQGIGLFRTEFIFMDRALAPTEEEQYLIYKSVLEGMKGLPVVIRTLDVGGDKQIPYLRIPTEANPFLGLRAIRYCLRNVEIFKTQLRALLRSSVHGRLSIMFPMISNLEEVLEARSLLTEIAFELKAQGVPVSADIMIGIMIEVPSAALLADVLAQHVDFFSIGTNDLIQYLCAVDRMNESIKELYDPYHPAVLRLIGQVIRAAQDQKIKVSMCGEMASLPGLSQVLLGLGLREFSMNPASILRMKKLVRATKLEDARDLSKKMLGLSSGREIKLYLDSLVCI